MSPAGTSRGCEGRDFLPSFLHPLEAPARNHQTPPEQLWFQKISGSSGLGRIKEEKGDERRKSWEQEIGGRRARKMLSHLPLALKAS